jgi:hypothetical protein
VHVQEEMMKTGKITTLILTWGALISFVILHPTKAQSQQPYVQQIVNAGASTFQGSVSGSDAAESPEIDPAVDVGDDGSGSTLSGTGSLVFNRTVGQGAGQGPNVNSGKKAKSNPILNLSFDGLNHRNQRLANGGKQFSVEPPDQGLCAGNGFVMEAVNDVLRVFDTSGTPLIDVVFSTISTDMHRPLSAATRVRLVLLSPTPVAISIQMRSAGSSLCSRSIG